MKTHEVTLTYRVTNACQRREALKGRAIPFENEIKVIIPLEEALDRKMATIGTDGNVITKPCAEVYGRVMTPDDELIQYDHVPSADEVLADWRAYKTQKAAKREAEAAEMRAWIAAHGSERLRLAMELGELDCMNKVYHDERRAYDTARLAAEYPGWQPACAGGRNTDPPSGAALRALAEARRTFPTAYIIHIYGKEAIRVDVIPGFEYLGPCHKFVN